jgi:hypothetical protein
MTASTGQNINYVTACLPAAARPVQIVLAGLAWGWALTVRVRRGYVLGLPWVCGQVEKHRTLLKLRIAAHRPTVRVARSVWRAVHRPRHVPVMGAATHTHTDRLPDFLALCTPPLRRWAECDPSGKASARCYIHTSVTSYRPVTGYLGRYRLQAGSGGAWQSVG